jgi:hypothetical protein
LKNLEGAVADFEKALAIAPNTKEYERELETSKKALEEAKRANSKRLIIEEEEEEEEEKPKHKMQKISVQKEEEEIEELVTPSASRLEAVQQKEQPKKSQDQMKPQVQPKAQEPQKNQESAKLKEKSIPVVTKVASKAPKQPPKTAYEFEKSIKDLDSRSMFEYLQIIPPDSFKKLFKESLTSSLLMNIVNTISNEFLKEGKQRDAFIILKNLAQNPRFEMTVMFLDDNEKKVLEHVFADFDRNLQGEPSLETVKKQYLI